MDSSPDLQGWKEIAAYLGKSVRAVQRWEREMGLPVHRLKTASAQTVFARRTELDAWKAQNSQPPSQDDVTSRRYPHRYVVLAAAILVVTAAGLAGAWRVRSTSATPASYRLAGNALEALSASGNVLWRHTFQGTLAPWWKETPAHLMNQIMGADVDGDGRKEVVVVTLYEQTPVMRSEQIFCFRDDGSLLWTYDPSSLVLSFKSGRYSDAWRINDVAISPGAGRQRIWVAVSHHTWWPSAVVELDAGGKPTTRFVQSGAVYALAAVQTPALRLLAGGINNEYGSGSLAFLDPDAVATSPQTPGSDYECTDCAPAAPPMYMVVPRTDVNRAGTLPYNRVGSIMAISQELSVMTGEAPHGAAAMLYRIGMDGRVKDVAPTDGFWVEHRALRARGALTHDEIHCPERKPRTVRFMVNGKWQTMTAAASGAPLPDTMHHSRH